MVKKRRNHEPGTGGCVREDGADPDKSRRALGRPPEYKAIQDAGECKEGEGDTGVANLCVHPHCKQNEENAS